MLFSTGYTATSLFDSWIITTNYLSGQPLDVPFNFDLASMILSLVSSLGVGIQLHFNVLYHPLSRVSDTAGHTLRYTTCSESAHFTATHSRVEYLHFNSPE